MEVNEIVTLLSNGVFSIVMCGLLFWYMVKQNESHKEEINSLKKTQEEQTKELTATINRLEIAITKLTDSLEAKQ